MAGPTARHAMAGYSGRVMVIFLVLGASCVRFIGLLHLVDQLCALPRAQLGQDPVLVRVNQHLLSPHTQETLSALGHKVASEALQ